MPFGKINSLRASIISMVALGRYGQATVGLPEVGVMPSPHPIDFAFEGLWSDGSRYDHGYGSSMKLRQMASLFKDKHLHGYCYCQCNDQYDFGSGQGWGSDSDRKCCAGIWNYRCGDLAPTHEAHTRGAGTDIIIIDGVPQLHGTRHQVIQITSKQEPILPLQLLLEKGIRSNNVLYEHLESYSLLS